MSIYTRNGDSGKTTIGAEVVDKFDPRIQAAGSVEELNAWLGLVISLSAFTPFHKAYKLIIEDLFAINAIILGQKRMIKLGVDRLGQIEKLIDDITSKLIMVPGKTFFLPGGVVPEPAWLHVLRAVCRRAEREVAIVNTLDDDFDPNILAYMNRLSDLFFIMSRQQNKIGDREFLWR